MARIAGVEREEAGIVARLAYFFTKRRLGRVITPIKVHAHRPRLLRGLAAMELAQQAVSSVDHALKELVNIRVAMRVGCPF